MVKVPLHPTFTPPRKVRAAGTPKPAPRCSSVKYSRYSPSSRLVRRAHRRPRSDAQHHGLLARRKGIQRPWRLKTVARNAVLHTLHRPFRACKDTQSRESWRVTPYGAENRPRAVPENSADPFGHDSRVLSVRPSHRGIVMPSSRQLDCEHDPPACRGRSVTLVGAGGWWPDPQLD